jgi:hypothetical protein
VLAAVELALGQKFREELHKPDRGQNTRATPVGLQVAMVFLPIFASHPVVAVTAAVGVRRRDFGLKANVTRLAKPSARMHKSRARDSPALLGVQVHSAWLCLQREWSLARFVLGASYLFKASQG